MKKQKGKADQADIFASLNGHQDVEFDLDDPKLMSELKAMGWEDEEEDMGDLDVKNLEKELETEMAQQEKQLAKYSKYGENDIENAGLDDEDLNDPELMAELEEIGGPNLQQERIQELEQQISTLRHRALEFKRANNREQAIALMKQVKSLEVELGNAQKIQNVQNIAKKAQPQDDPKPQAKAKRTSEKQVPAEPVEEEEFNYDEIVSLSVLEYEKDNNKDPDIRGKMNMAITLLTTNIQTGMLDQDDYVAEIQKKIQEYTQKIPSASGEFKARLQKHVDLMKQELEEAEEEDDEEEEEEEEEPARTSVSHADLMKSSLLYKAAFEHFEDLKGAFTYLKNIGAGDRAEQLLKQAEGIHAGMQEFQKGNNPDIQINPLLPQHITGMEEKERKKKLTQMAKFSAEKAALAKQKAVESLRIKDQETAKQFKAIMKACEARTQELEAAMDNPWQIPPEITVKHITRSVLANNEDLKPGQLEIRFGKTSGLNDKESYILIFTLSASNSEISKTTDRTGHPESKGFRRKDVLNLDNKTYQTLARRRFKVEIFEHHRIRSNKSQGSATFKLEEFAGKCTIETNLNLSKRGPTVELTMRIHQSLEKPEYRSEAEDFEIVESLPSPFRNVQPQESMPRKIPPQRQNLPEESKAPPTSNANQPKPQAPSNTAENAGPIPSDLSPAEIADPNVVENLNSYEVLEIEDKRLQQLMITYRENGKNTNALVGRQREVMKKKMIIEAQVENGVISPEQYKEVLQNQVQHDMVLARYFKDQGNRANLEIVVNRVKIMKGEIAELENAE